MKVLVITKASEIRALRNFLLMRLILVGSKFNILLMATKMLAKSGENEIGN